MKGKIRVTRSYWPTDPGYKSRSCLVCEKPFNTTPEVRVCDACHRSRRYHEEYEATQTRPSPPPGDWENVWKQGKVIA